MAGPGDERRFSDEEFALVLRKAVELQEHGEPPPAVRGGVSLAEMQQIAREAGIDPDLIARAAAVLPRAPSRRGGLLGAPEKYRLEASVPGEVSEASFDRIVTAIRRAAEHQGEINKPLRGLEWSSLGEVSQLSVNVTPGEGRTSIHVFADRGGAVFLTFFLSFMAWLLTTVAIGASLQLPLLPSLGIVAGGILGWLTTARTIWKSISRGYSARLQRILERTTEATRGATLALTAADDEGSDGEG